MAQQLVPKMVPTQHRNEQIEVVLAVVTKLRIISQDAKQPNRRLISG